MSFFSYKNAQNEDPEVLPSTSGIPDGWSLVVQNGEPVWSAGIVCKGIRSLSDGDSAQTFPADTATDLTMARVLYDSFTPAAIGVVPTEYVNISTQAQTTYHVTAYAKWAITTPVTGYAFSVRIIYENDETQTIIGQQYCDQNATDLNFFCTVSAEFQTGTGLTGNQRVFCQIAPLDGASGPTCSVAVFAFAVHRIASDASIPTPVSGVVSSLNQGVGITLSPNPIVSTGTISLADTAVTPGSYGSSSLIPVLTIDQQGRITAASTAAASAPSITATSPIVVTPSPITGTGVISHANSGATAGTYGAAGSGSIPSVTVNATGHITSISANTLTSKAVTGGTGIIVTGDTSFYSPSGTGMVITSTALDSVATRNWRAASFSAITAAQTDSVAIGDTALASGFSVSVGSKAGGTALLQSVAIGYQAGGNSPAGSLVAIGYNSGRGSGASNSTFVGWGSGAAVTGVGNTCIGLNAGGTTLTTGTSNVLIGNGADTGAAGTSAGIAIGAAAIVSGSESVMVGFNGISSGTDSTALGGRASATNTKTLALGWTSSANSTNSSAVGANASASAASASCFGQGSTASGTNSTAIGQGSSTTASYANAFGVGVSNSTASTTLIGDGSGTPAAHVVKSTGFFRSNQPYSCQAGRTNGTTQTVTLPGPSNLTWANTVWDTPGSSVSGNTILVQDNLTWFRVIGYVSINAFTSVGANQLVMKLHFYDGTTDNVVAASSYSVSAASTEAFVNVVGYFKSTASAGQYVYADMTRYGGGTTTAPVVNYYTLTLERCV